MNAPYAALGIALAVGIVLTAAARKIAPLAGLVDRPGSEPHKGHAATVPYGGGPAVLLATAGAVAFALLIEGGLAARPHSNPASEADWTRLSWLGAGTLAMALVGLWDDHRPISAYWKLAVQALTATLVVVVGDIRITMFIPAAPLIPAKAVTVALSIVWLLLVTNAINLLDNHDGLAGGVVAIAALFLGVLCLSNGEEAAGTVLLALAGASLGFLLFNFPPATIYLGDSGSLAAGFLLGGLCIIPAFYYSEAVERALPVAVLAPVFILAVPLFDTLRVLGLRLASHRPLLLADRQHFSHRLSELGFNPREIAGIHYLLALLTGGGAVLLPRVGWQGAFFLLAQLFGTLTLVAILERGGGGASR